MNLGVATPSYAQVLLELAEDNDRLVVMTAENRAALRGVSSQLGDRFIDTGITEQTLVGSAAGLALRGYRPVAHGLAAFLTMRAFEFCRTDIGIAGLPVKLVGSVAGFLSDGNGPTHQAIEDIALMRQIPGMRIFAPTDRADLVAGLPAILADDNPWYIRFVDTTPHLEHRPFEVGRAETLVEGDRVTILTYGFMAETAVAASAILGEQGMSARVMSMRSLAPIDRQAIIEAFESEVVVTVEDHLHTGGLASIVAEIALETSTSIEHNAIDLDRWFAPGRLHDVLVYEGFTAEAIARSVLLGMES